MSRRINAYLKFSFVFLIVKSDLKQDVRNRVRELQERSKRLYGEPQRRAIKQWELDIEDRLSYPYGDKQKLSEIAHLWSRHYACTSRVVDTITAGHLPGISVAVYEGTVARIPCGLCVAPGEAELVSWLYAKSMHNLTFNTLEEKYTMVVDINLTIYNVKSEDAGVYICRLGSSDSGLAVLEVVDDEEYDVLNLSFSNGRYPAPPIRVTTNLGVYTAWSVWSECSRCDVVGERRRNGMCYVRYSEKTDKPTAKDNSTASLDKATTKILQEFPGGIYCRSHLLPSSIRNIAAVYSRNNEIMTDLCKMPCKEIFEIRSKTGKLIEKANNTAGLYSLSQRAPPQPLAPVRDAVYAECGHRLYIKCPGTTLRDIPVTWRIGTKSVDPRSLDKESEGRVRLNGRDHIVIASVQYSDANVYSCWQCSNLAGVVKLGVWQDARYTNRRPLAIVSLLLAIVALRVAARLLRYKRRHVS